MSEENFDFQNLENFGWMTKEYFQELLRKDVGDSSVVVEKFHVSPAVGKGENYSSQILRVFVDFQCGPHNKRSQNFIVKAAFQKQEIMENKFFIFSREIAAYNDVIPEIQRILLSVHDKTSFAPSFHGFGVDPHYLVFEDLMARGYKLMDRSIGLDFEHLKLCLTKVAKFHAATATLFEMDPSTFSKHRFKNINQDASDFHEFFKNCTLEMARKAKHWEGCEKLAGKLEKLGESVVEKTCNAFNDESCQFKVLNHGDLWCSNILWKHDRSNKPIDCLMVDFAVCYLGSPGLDLSYLLFTSSSNDVQDKEIDWLLQHYHEELVGNLKIFGYKNRRFPSLIDIQCEFLRRGYYGLMFANVVMPLRFLEDTAHADLDSLLDQTEKAQDFRKQIFGSHKLEERMTFLLDYFDRKGFLDSS